MFQKLVQENMIWKKKKKIMLTHAWIQITHRSLEWCCFKKLHLNQLKCNFSTFCTPCTDDTYVKPELPPLENGSPNKEGIPASLPPIGKTKRYGGCICNIVYSWSICKPPTWKSEEKKSPHIIFSFHQLESDFFLWLDGDGKGVWLWIFRLYKSIVRMMKWKKKIWGGGLMEGGSKA